MTMFARSSRKTSKFAVAAAIMSVGAFGATVVGAPAHAQKQSANYSDDFIQAAAPLNEALNGDAPDFATLRPQIEALGDLVETPDDRFVFGSMLNAVGSNTSTPELQRRGIEAMLQSGKVPEQSVPQYTYAAGQLAYNAGDFAAARERLQRAAELGYEADNARALIARSYSDEGNAAGALEAIGSQIDEQVAAGRTPDENLLRRGLTVAYNNSMYEDATDYSVMLVENYPSQQIWADAIAIQRNFGDQDDGSVLDLLRLARTTDAMREQRDYYDYINVANFRRLPAEVGEVAQEGVDAGMLQTSDPFVNEALTESQELAPGLRSDLPVLESDAREAGASASVAVAAGDAYLNFDEAAQAAEMYELALTRPDVDMSLAQTRLGIAQTMAGDYAAAQETLGRVEGTRQPTARLWAAYAKQQANGGGMAMGSN